MKAAKLSVKLVKDQVSDHWTIEVNGFAEFREKLGTDVLNAFARCFLHVDRLNSLTGFAFFTHKEYGETSPAYSRDLQTVVWFAVGTLRELAVAIRDLKAALAKRDALDPKSAPWVRLQELEKRWEGDAFFRKMRDWYAFHVDQDLTEKGLVELDNEKTVVVIEGEGSQDRRAWLKLGLEALIRGGDKDEDDFGRFISAVAQDQGVSGTIQEAFLLALEAQGIPYGT